jgi:hypothetical protein
MLAPQRPAVHPVPDSGTATRRLPMARDDNESPITNPRFQSGLRYSPTKDIDLDVIYGRNLLGEGANWITLGLTVRIGDN